jgi:hypothetical protein
MAFSTTRTDQDSYSVIGVYNVLTLDKGIFRVPGRMCRIAQDVIISTEQCEIKNL